METTLEYRTNRDLFSNHYLDEQLPQTEEWNAADETRVREAYEELRWLYRDQSDLVAEYNERQLRRNLLDPVFEQLGLTTAVEEPVRGQRLRPDYTLFESERARKNAFESRSDGGSADESSGSGSASGTSGSSTASRTSGSSAERSSSISSAARSSNDDFHSHALAVADAKRWGQSLDGRGERESTDSSYQIHVYLDATGLDRGILTNGRRWRLYHGPTSHRLDSYYEIDLPTLLETGDPEEFKYFYLFFRREALSASDFGPDPPFVERVHRRSNRFAEELSEDLRENVYEALTVLAEGFVTGADDVGSEDLDRVYEASLTYLYRLIFVLYAESDGRDLLDTDNDLYRKRYSLNTLKRRVADELDSPDPIYREWQTTLWDRLGELFTLVDSGSAAQGIPEEDLYVPAYNGGLFETGPTDESADDPTDDTASDGTVTGDQSDDSTAAFLQSHSVGDVFLARVIELLTRRDSSGGDSSGGNESSPDSDGRVFVDYSSLDVRHLGSIYEGLLEYDLEIADEPLVAVRDEGEEQWVAVDDRHSDDGDDAEGEDGDKEDGKDEKNDEDDDGDDDNEDVEDEDDEDDEGQIDEDDEKNDEDVVKRVDPGEVYLTTETGKRKATGSYYTPEFVVEYVVERTLDPLLDEIRADLDRDDPRFADAFAERVFDLAVLDPAMGSGHFLVKTVEYLARAVVEAQQEQVERLGAATVDDPGDVHWARRQVAKQCIYGVDSNGMAVELAKVSLWLRTLAAEQPLAFLDHHLEQGDSLAGTDVEAVEELARDTGPNASSSEFGATRADAIGDLMDAYREFVAIENETLSDVKEMERRYAAIQRDDLRRRLTAMANVHAAERFGLDVPSGAYERMGRSLDDDRAWEEVRERSWFHEAQRLADERDFFHWKLAFPEAFYDGDGVPKAESATGFDAVVGNPPYVRSRNLPDELKEYYRREFRTATGAYDLYVPFVELAADLGRRVSLVVPNKWTTTEYGREVRDRLLDDHCLREVLDASNLDVFPDVDVYPVVVTCEQTAAVETPESAPEDGTCEQSDDPAESDDAAGFDDAAESDDATGSGDADEIEVRRPADEDALADAPTTAVSRSFVDRLGERVVPLNLDPAFAEIADRVLVDCDRFGDHVTLSEGVHTGNVREKLLTDDFAEEGEKDGPSRKIVGGDAIDRYRLDWDGTWLRYDESLLERERGEYASLRASDVFEGEKLLVRDISDRPVAVYDDEDYYALNTLYSVRPREDSDLSLRYLLGVFNSEFAATYFRQVYGGTHVSGDYLRFKPMFAEQLPIPDPGAAAVGPDESVEPGESVDPGEIVRDKIVRDGIVRDEIARDGIARGEVEDLSEDPEEAVATLTERLRAARDERASLNLDVLDYLGRDPARSDAASGPTLGEIGIPVEGVGDSILAETTADREGLRIGEVWIGDIRDGEVLVSDNRGGKVRIGERRGSDFRISERRGGRGRVGENRDGATGVQPEAGELTLTATARYKPGAEVTDCETNQWGQTEVNQWGQRGTDQWGQTEVDQWGYAETDPVPAMRFPGLGETETALVEAFVSAAAERGEGFAGFRRNATKTNSLLDRLRALTLPDPAAHSQEVARFREMRERADELAERIESLERAIDAIVYRLYGLDDEEIAVVEDL